MPDLRAGLIGLGAMGRNHARVLASLEGVDFVCVADATAAAGETFQGRPVHPDLEHMVSEGLDYVVVATPTATHQEIASQVADAGLHALVEKPLTLDAADARQLATIFATRGLVGAVGHIERYNPALQQARTRIANGDLGEIYQIATRRQGPFPGRIADVGVILDLATHDLDLTSWVADSPYRTISARTAHRSGRPHEDLVAITGDLQRGVVVNHLVNWVSPLKERVTVITGERGALIANTLTADLTMYENSIVPTEWPVISSFRGVAEGNVIRYAFPKPEPLRVEHERFRDAVLGQETDIVTFEQAAATVAAANAAAQSARTGTVVEVGQ